MKRSWSGAEGYGTDDDLLDASGASPQCTHATRFPERWRVRHGKRDAITSDVARPRRESPVQRDALREE